MVTDREWDKTKAGISFSPNRVRVTLRFVRTNGSINVKISSAEEDYRESSKGLSSSSKASSFYYWEVKGSFPELEKTITDRIASKLNLKLVEEAK